MLHYFSQCKLMKKLSLYFFIVIISGLFSCNPEFYCKRCPVKIHDTTVITKSDSVVIRDTILKIEADTVTIIDSVPCQDFKKEFDSKRAKIKIEVKDKVLTASCICKALEFKAQLKDRYHNSSTLHSRIETVQVKGRKTGWQIFKDWLPWILLAYIIFRISWWILKKYPIKI